MSTSWTQADIEALEAAIKRGAVRVKFGEREVQYQSATEMLKLLQTMKDEVEGGSTAGSAGRTTYTTFRKGPRQ
jgi:hypothetical protein